LASISPANGGQRAAASPVKAVRLEYSGRPPKEKAMKMSHSIVAAVIAGLFALPAVAQTPTPNPAKDAVKADREKLKADRKDVKQDAANVKADREKLKADQGNKDAMKADREKLKADRADLKKDKHEVHKDKEQLRKDVKAARPAGDKK
jgi:hypothetical protein